MRELPKVDKDFLSVRRDDDALRPALATLDASQAHHLCVSHGGAVAALSSQPGRFVDASASINPLGAPEWLRQEIESSISELGHYPDPQCTDLRVAIAEAHGVTINEVVVGNGSSELLAWLPLVVVTNRFVVPVPSYGEYKRSAALSGCKLLTPRLGAAPDFALDFDALEQYLDEPSVVLLGHPNNPTGTLLDVARFHEMRKRHPETLFVVDEAFADFCDNFESVWAPHATNLVVLRSLTKCLKIAGLRLGYAVATPEFCRRMRDRLPPWSVNLLSQRVGLRFFRDHEYAARMREGLRPLKQQLHYGLETLTDCRVYAGAANWVLLELPKEGPKASDVAQACLERQVALRVCDDFPSLEERFLRVSVRSQDETRRVVDALKHVLGCPVSSRGRRQRHALMLQGTSSDAGKSLLVTALCRCLEQDGYRVAPFKAQNMSNNSGIASDGGEMGRAQIVQAQACRILPDTRMNPVLLKPTSDRGSQVVLRGQVQGHRDVLGYIATKQRCLEASLEAFDDLSRQYDVVICEGAGSSGEMNLRENDIVNMGFVERRNMPVLLVGDIDRGGVYASFVGHLSVMSELDRSHVRGFLVNRFRGDSSLLAPAHEWVKKHTGRPVLGVIPYLKDLRLPEEDRLSLESGRKQFGSPDAPIRIAVIAPPHVSNATDIDPLIAEPDVFLHIVERPEEMGHPDAVILLGTKNTMGDLARLREVGLDRAIVTAHTRGAQIVGICGGLQMLGETISDPDRVEGLKNCVKGLSLLPITTQFFGEKQVQHSTAKHLPSGLSVSGYEIHHGATDFSKVTPLFVTTEGKVIGGGTSDQRVLGTYLHGLFDSDAFRAEFIDTLREAKGLPRCTSDRTPYGLESVFDQLADTFREHTDYAAILRMLGLT